MPRLSSMDYLNFLGGTTGRYGPQGPDPPGEALTQEEQLERVMQHFESVNEFFIQKVAAQIARIGELIPSTMHIVEIMASMNEDIAAINARIAKAAELATADLYKLYNKALTDEYESPRFRRALEENPLPEEDRKRIENYTRYVARQTAGTMQNLSNTTIQSEQYRQAVDKAIVATNTGGTDYKTMVRETVREIGHAGLQIQYPSGYHRRLDTAVRQNVIDGAKQITQHASRMVGEALEYDAIELSAHLASAPDHEPVQGRVFLLAEFDKMQAGEDFTDADGNHYTGFRRPIGEWNCMHLVRSFDTEYSKRRYTNEQLAKWAKDNADGCEINGKKYTLYEARQRMRQIETAIRHEKDAAIAAEAAGDEVLRQQCQQRIDRLYESYRQTAKASGFKPRYDRAHVDGFQAVKVNKPSTKETAKSKTA